MSRGMLHRTGRCGFIDAEGIALDPHDRDGFLSVDQLASGNDAQTWRTVDSFQERHFFLKGVSAMPNERWVADRTMLQARLLDP